jgi:site-specific recombinase XerD
MLFSTLKFSPNTVIQRLGALRFFYIKVLKKNWSVAETPYPRKVIHLPQILSLEEVTRLINAADSRFHRAMLLAHYATGARRTEAAHLKVGDIDSRRMVVHIHSGKGNRDRLGERIGEEMYHHRSSDQSTGPIVLENGWRKSGKRLSWSTAQIHLNLILTKKSRI